jgi:hypothetical protein
MTQPASLPTGRYDVESTLGEGGMGVVYRARDVVTGKVVALKRLVVPNDSMRSLLTALFEREFHTLSQLSHPAVIRVFDYGVDTDGPYYTMELLEGTDLRSREDIGSDELCQILYGVASALSLLHARRLVHRDVTSANVRLLGGGQARLIDFGALAPMGHPDRLVGTPSYVAPEVAHLQPLDGRADLYSLGVVAYRALTGRYPYRVARMHDLRAAWQVPPLAPIELSPEVPAKLSELTMSLIALDRDLRPRNAAEVMERLAAITSVPRLDAPEASRAYLVTPMLVGRIDALQEIRELVVGTLRGKGGSLVFRGPSGVGRSRTIDAAAVEAQVLGATVLRLGATGDRRDFAAIEALLDELRTGPGLLTPEVATELAKHRAQRSGRDHPGRRRLEVINWLCRSLGLLARHFPLVIVADDLQALDEPSIAVLASVARDAPHASFALIGTLPDASVAEPVLSLRVLLERSKVLPLEPLDERGTRSLVRSLFGTVPGVDALAGKIHRLSRGKPRDTLALAEHLLDRDIVTYGAGAFSIPEVVDLDELPQSLSAALESRARKLSPLALTIAQLHALAGSQGLTREDCQRASAEVDAGEVLGALDELVAADILGPKGAEYGLRHEAWRAALVESCTGAERAVRHRGIAALLEARSEDPLAQAYHLMRAGDESAVERVASYTAELTGEEAGIFATTRLTASELGWLLSSARRVFEASDKQLTRTVANIRRYLIALGVFFDARWFFDAIESAEEALMTDSGAFIRQSLDPAMDPLLRTLEALRQAQAAYDAAPEVHVYPPAEAIRHLVQYVAAAIAIGARTADAELRRRLPALLEPFAPLSPIVAAMKENSHSAAEMSYGDYESAIARLIPVVDALGAPDAASLEHAAEIRAACNYAIGAYTARLGIQDATRWLDEVGEHPRHASNVRRVRAFLALQSGDTDEARAYHEAAEQYDLEHDSPQLFGRAGIIAEIDIHARALDLTALRQLIVAIKPHAERFAGWRPNLSYAQAEYERLRGDLPAALAGFDEATASSLPRRDGEHPDSCWYAAEAGALETLLELGRLEECKARALRGLTFADGKASGARYDGVKRALALCEARLGQFDQATNRLDAMVAYRKGIGSSGLGLGLLYEAHTLVELWRNDRAAAGAYFALAARELGPREGSAFARRLDFLTRRLADDERLRSRVSPLGAERPPARTEGAPTEAMTSLTDCEPVTRVDTG